MTGEDSASTSVVVIGFQSVNLRARRYAASVRRRNADLARIAPGLRFCTLVDKRAAPSKRSRNKSSDARGTRLSRGPHGEFLLMLRYILPTARAVLGICIARMPQCTWNGCQEGSCHL
jgi:hypothetical protein